MSVIRRSTRLENPDRLKSIFIKLFYFLRLFQSDFYTLRIQCQCKEINKIFCCVTLHFYDLYNYRGSQMDPFFNMLYCVSFRFMRQMEEIHEPMSLLIKKKMFCYRKVYEQYREKSWGTNQWPRYLGRDILNIISSYLYG